jgi:hypothetical protein
MSPAAEQSRRRAADFTRIPSRDSRRRASAGRLAAGQGAAKFHQQKNDRARLPPRKAHGGFLIRDGAILQRGGGGGLGFKRRIDNLGAVTFRRDANQKPPAAQNVFR